MKYILILGQNYRDCKAKHDNIVKEADATYTYVTKPKHVNGFESCGFIEADNAALNPLIGEIKGYLTGYVTKPLPTPAPTTPLSIPVPTTPLPTPVEEVIPPITEVEVEEPVVEEPVEVPMSDELPVVEEEISSLDEVTLSESDLPDVEIHGDSMIGLSVVEEEPVVEEEVVVEEEPVVEEEVVVEEEEVVIIKPVSPPRGWHARAEYIDVDGNIFKKGKYSGNINE